MVADFFEMAGWDCFYLGANTPVEAIVDAVKAKSPHLLALSATITTNITRVKNIIQQVREAGQSSLKIMVGGYPFNVEPQAWQKIGADGYAADADSAVETAFRLVNSA